MLSSQCRLLSFSLALPFYTPVHQLFSCFLTWQPFPVLSLFGQCILSALNLYISTQKTCLPTRHRSQTLCLLPLFSVLITLKYRNSLFYAIWASDSTSISFKFSVRDKEALECQIQVWVWRWKLHYQDEEGRQTRVCGHTSHPVWVKHQYEDKTQGHI